MSQEGLAEWLQAHQQAMQAKEEQRSTHETILGFSQPWRNGTSPIGRSLRLLTLQGTRLADEPTNAALYRQAAADIRQMQEDEH